MGGTHINVIDLWKTHSFKKKKCTQGYFKPRVDPEQVSIQGKFSEVELDPENGSSESKNTPLNDLEITGITERLVTLPHRNPSTSKCRLAKGEGHIPHLNL